MDTGILHFHRLLVIVYPLLMLFFWGLILLNQKRLYVTLRGKLRYLRMSMEILLVLTGIYLAFRSPVGTSVTMLVKYGVMLVAILCFVFGLVKINGFFIMAGLVAWLYAYGISKTQHPFLISQEQQVAQMKEGKALYQTLCVRCHGIEGNALFQKASNLKAQHFSKEKILNALNNGKNLMPSFPYLSQAQKDSLVLYIQSLSSESKN